MSKIVVIYVTLPIPCNMLCPVLPKPSLYLLNPTTTGCYIPYSVRARSPLGMVVTFWYNLMSSNMLDKRIIHKFQTHTNA